MAQTQEVTHPRPVLSIYSLAGFLHLKGSTFPWVKILVWSRAAGAGALLFVLHPSSAGRNRNLQKTSGNIRGMTKKSVTVH